MVMKTLPIGIEDFEQASSKYYVDKTLIIKDIVDGCLGQSVLVTRPRRFGKSLTLSMLEHFFSNKKDSKSLFAGKKIASCGEKYLSYMNAYPVIRINMKNINQPDYDGMMKMVIGQISSMFRNHAEVLEGDLFELEVRRYNDIANERLGSPLEYTQAIAFLAELLHKRYQKRAIILIDEYDTPLENAQQYGFYDQAIEFFKRFYSAGLKANEHQEFAFVTGVLQISKESIFSELNNLAVFGPIDKTFNEYFGFLEQEVLDAMQYFGVDGDISELRAHYAGYGIDGTIYSPWSILNYLLSERIDSYWVNSGSNKTVNRLIDDIPGSIEMLNEFVNNESKTFFFNRAITYSDIRNDYETLFSYLVQTGYLAAKPIKNSTRCLLYIPNLEVRFAFETEIIARNLDKGAFDVAKALRNAILSGAEENISYCLKNYVFDQFSYYDKLNEEKDFQMVINGIMGILFNDYLVRPEVNGRYGRCDIMLSPKSGKGVGAVIEIKKYKGKISKARFEKYATDALTQIKEKGYGEELIRLGAKPILLYAFIFGDHGNYVKVEELK